MRPTASGEDRPRRFYTRVEVADAGDGLFSVALDGRAVRTPAGAPLHLPTEALAGLVAQEWDGQGESLDLQAMDAHRMASTVIDRTAGAGGALAAEVGRYAGSDVLCYRAEGPDALVAAEAQGWDPILSWAAEALGVLLQPVAGVVHRPQSGEALARVEALATALDPFTLAGVAWAAPFYGSAVLALAVERRRLDAEAAFDLSRLDEAFQEARWGVDADAARRTARLRGEAGFLQRWFDALR